MTDFRGRKWIAQPELKAVAAEIFKNMRRRCRRHRISHSLYLADVAWLLEQCGGRCAVTGVAFNMGKLPGAFRRPWAPSLDRIDSSLGYNMKNCRIVCVAANAAMNEWGESALRIMAESLLSGPPWVAR